MCNDLAFNSSLLSGGNVFTNFHMMQVAVGPKITRRYLSKELRFLGCFLAF